MNGAAAGPVGDAGEPGGPAEWAGTGCEADSHEHPSPVMSLLSRATWEGRLDGARRRLDKRMPARDGTEAACWRGKGLPTEARGK